MSFVQSILFAVFALSMIGLRSICLYEDEKLLSQYCGQAILYEELEYALICFMVVNENDIVLICSMSLSANAIA